MNIRQVKRSGVLFIICIAVAGISAYLLETFSIDMMAILIIASVITAFYALVKLLSGLLSTGEKDIQQPVDERSYNPVISQEQTSPELQEDVNMRSVVITTMIAGVLCVVFFVLVEALTLGVYVIIGIIVLLSRQLSRARKAKKITALRKQHLLQAGIYLAAFILCVFMTAGSFSAKEKKTQTLISACEKYKSKYGRYPDTLAALVPEFIDSQPSSSFRYIQSDGRHLLVTVTIPPFGRKIYNFEEKKTTTLD